MSVEVPKAKSRLKNKTAYSVRASQAVLQYGVGAMVDFRDRTLMTAAPEYWRDSIVHIHDERLEKILEDEPLDQIQEGTETVEPLVLEELDPDFDEEVADDYDDEFDIELEEFDESMITIDDSFTIESVPHKTEDEVHGTASLEESIQLLEDTASLEEDIQRNIDEPEEADVVSADVLKKVYNSLIQSIKERELEERVSFDQPLMFAK